MGLSYSNIHIKKTEGLSAEAVKNYIIDTMRSNGYRPSAGRGEITAVIFSPADSEWISVAADNIEFAGYEDTKSTALAFSKRFNTDVMAALCCDSDWGFAALFNRNEEGWINIGETYFDGYLHPDSLDAWKSRVRDFGALKRIRSNTYTFAEDAFAEMAPLLKMAPEQTCIDVGNIPEDGTDTVVMCFTAGAEERNRLPELKLVNRNMRPCVMDVQNLVTVENKGGNGKGLRIMFTGDFLANGEIGFKDVAVETETGNCQNRRITPVELKKSADGKGNSLLYWDDRNFEIKNDVAVRFVPYGNKRKVLDITVWICPLSNVQGGSACWNVWKGLYRSKLEYINGMNADLKQGFGNIKLPYDMTLNPDDYDLD